MITLAVATLVSVPTRAQDEDTPPQDEMAYPEPDPNVDSQAFDDALSPYGEWVTTDAVGRAWQPSSIYVGADFHPYVTGGHWVNTEFGWSFESDYPWGWATFHYGRWAFLPGYGWLWVPGRVWAPAWVYWRYGGNYIGWAPLPPIGVTLAYTDYRPWCFLETRYFPARNFYSYALPPNRFHAAFAVTAPFRARYHRAGTAWYSGPPAGEISRHAAMPVPYAHVVPPAPGRVHPAQVGTQAYVHPAPAGRGSFGSAPHPTQHWSQPPSQFNAPPAQRSAPPGVSRPRSDAIVPKPGFGTANPNSIPHSQNLPGSAWVGHASPAPHAWPGVGSTTTANIQAPSHWPTTGNQWAGRTSPPPQAWPSAGRSATPNVRPPSSWQSPAGPTWAGRTSPAPQAWPGAGRNATPNVRPPSSWQSPASSAWAGRVSPTPQAWPRVGHPSYPSVGLGRTAPSAPIAQSYRPASIGSSWAGHSSPAPRSWSAPAAPPANSYGGGGKVAAPSGSKGGWGGFAHGHR